MNQAEKQIRELIALDKVRNEGDYARHTFVEAGAGAGKTTLICSRICNLLRKGIYKPEELVVITFTNKAAVELYDRIYKRLDAIKGECSGEEAQRVQYARENIDRMCISTIHSFCKRILTEQIFYAGRGMDFQLVEGAESTQLKKRFLREWFVDYTKDSENWENTNKLERLLGRNYYQNVIEPTFLAVCDRFDEELAIPQEFWDIYGKKTIDDLVKDHTIIILDENEEIFSSSTFRSNGIQPCGMR